MTSNYEKILKDTQRDNLFVHLHGSGPPLSTLNLCSIHIMVHWHVFKMEVWINYNLADYYTRPNSILIIKFLKPKTCQKLVAWSIWIWQLHNFPKTYLRKKRCALLLIDFADFHLQKSLQKVHFRKSDSLIVLTV